MDSTVIPYQPPPANNQEFYDRVVAYFSRPGADFAVDQSGRCKYRTEGKACGVGCVLPDDIYTWELDSPDNGGGSIKHALNPDRRAYLKFTEVANYFADVDLDFMSQIQTEHDSAAGSDTKGVHEFLERLKIIAPRYDVKVD